MNVRLGVLRWLNLDDQLNIWNVESSGGYISGDENLKLGFLESLDGAFSLILRDISMHHLNVMLDLVRELK